MIRSMTAFARESASGKNNKWTLEIRSLNHRYFEFSSRLPSDLLALEGKVRDKVNSVISRGKVTLSVTANGDDGSADDFVFDEAAAKKYLKGFKRLARNLHLPDDISAREILSFPKVVTAQKDKLSADKIWPELETVLKKVLEKAIRAKTLEGRKISQDIRKRLVKIQTAVKKIEKMVQARSQYYFEKMKERLTALLGEKAGDDEKLWREVAFLAEKSDITEEIVRMRSHLDLFFNRLTHTGEVGRELDFLCQEMHRETNTMGSKSQFFEITKEVVFIKGEIEKIREQIQNVE